MLFYVVIGEAIHRVNCPILQRLETQSSLSPEDYHFPYLFIRIALRLPVIVVRKADAFSRQTAGDYFPLNFLIHLRKRTPLVAINDVTIGIWLTK